MQRKFLHQINMVPFIDIMLVLLIVFMVTATLVPTSVIDLPSVGQASAPNSNLIHVEILNNKTIILRTDNQKSDNLVPISSNELPSKLQEILAHNPSLPVVISAPKDIAYDEVIKVMDLLQSKGVAQLGLAVQVTQ